jgi:cytochrome c6
MKDVIRGQIAYPDPAGAMKANLVQGADANSVATYVAQCAGDSNCGVTAATPPTTTSASGGTTTTTTTTPTKAGGTSNQLAVGKQIFLVKAGCGGCHTLKDAGSTGTVGPNLEQLKPADETVEHQGENGGGVMPAFKGTLTKAEIDAVSAYVSSVAGK